MHVLDEDLLVEVDEAREPLVLSRHVEDRRIDVYRESKRVVVQPVGVVGAHLAETRRPAEVDRAKDAGVGRSRGELTMLPGISMLGADGALPLLLRSAQIPCRAGSRRSPHRQTHAPSRWGSR